MTASSWLCVPVDSADDLPGVPVGCSLYYDRDDYSLVGVFVPIGMGMNWSLLPRGPFWIYMQAPQTA